MCSNNMYVSGTQYDYLNRVHQFCENSGDLTNFHTEANLYGALDQNLQFKWDKEEDKRIGGQAGHAIFFPSGFPFFI